MGAFWVGGGLGVYSYQSFFLWNRRDGEESLKSEMCFHIYRRKIIYLD